MMRESEQLLVPLEEIFDRNSAEYFRTHGVNGIILIELSSGELKAIALKKGCEVEDFNHPPRIGDVGMIVSRPKLKFKRVFFFTKTIPEGEEVYILDEDFERFKEMFLSI